MLCDADLCIADPMVLCSIAALESPLLTHGHAGAARRMTRVEHFIKEKHKDKSIEEKHKSIDRFKETFLKRKGFQCFNLEGNKFAPAKKNKWFVTSAWVFGDFKGILDRRQGAKQRKKRGAV